MPKYNAKGGVAMQLRCDVCGYSSKVTDLYPLCPACSSEVISLSNIVTNKCAYSSYSEKDITPLDRCWAGHNID